MKYLKCSEYLGARDQERGRKTEGCAVLLQRNAEADGGMSRIMRGREGQKETDAIKERRALQSRTGGSGG